MKSKIITAFSLILSLSLSGCMEDFMDIYPEDKITSAIFPENKDDLKLLLNGVYALLRENTVFEEGLFGFGVTDGCTPNAFNWGNQVITRIGNGTLTTGVMTYRWTRCFAIISRANYLLSVIDKAEISDEDKSIFEGEAHFLRGLAYSILAETYGGVPIITKPLTTEEARELHRATLEETWQQAISDYDVAIQNLKPDAPEIGRATKGAALGMKMRAYLYQNKYSEVLTVIEQIDALGKYSLFPSYEGLFKAENENNSEVIFDVQYMIGEYGQGSFLDQYCGTGTGRDRKSVV